MKILVHYTLLSLIILAFAIIYLYLFKIILTWSFPSNQIFRILAILFVFYLPIWLMNNYYEGDFLAKINNKLPILFIPFIPLEIYSLGVRIVSNGFTNMRYIGIMLIIIEIVYIVIYLKKKNIDYLFYLVPIILVITFIFPYFNMYDISVRSQSHIMDNLLMRDNLSDAEKYTLYSSYTYLKSSYQGGKYLEKYSNDTIEEISSYYNYRDAYHFRYLNANKELDNIDITNYQTLYHIEYREYNLNKEKIIINKNNLQLDVTTIIMAYIENADNIDDYFQEHYEYTLDNGKLIINNIIIEYDENNLSMVTLNGLFLN